MPPRLRAIIVVAFSLLVVYFLLSRSNDTPLQRHANPPPVDALKGNSGAAAAGGHKDGATKGGAAGDGAAPLQSKTKQPHPTPEPHGGWKPPSAGSAEPEEAPGAVGGTSSALVSQEQFQKEYDALGLKDGAGAIYGSTLNHLVSVGGHAGFAATALTPTNSWTAYGPTPPLNYNPYPEYNDKAWNASNLGTYVPCDWPGGAIVHVKAFSGHPETFDYAPMGSYIPLGIDSNLCFERESRLGAYGYSEGESSSSVKSARDVSNSTDWDSVNWGLLQQQCVERNSDRYTQAARDNSSRKDGTVVHKNSSPAANHTKVARVKETIEDEAEARKQGLHGMPELAVKAKPRTAVLVRTYCGQDFSDNDKQTIRSLVSELSLRSGGEYQVYLLAQMKDNSVPIWPDTASYDKAVHDNIPQEFWNMTVLWNYASTKTLYPLLAESTSKFNQSHWFSVQKFAQDRPEFAYYWNWELESRYTGHHYNLLEKLAVFAAAQPRKGLWERNERYYIPSIHGPYDSKFRATVERQSGSDTVWGPQPTDNLVPVGPPRPVAAAEEDRYSWGVGEEADFISLAPIFNPIDTAWAGKDEIWGYSGADHTPRRASIITQSRVSKKLIDTMHEENLKGNHLGSNMTAPTVALLHGLKAVAAPMPVFFDRAWEGSALDRWFNPGRKGQSGSTLESPFSRGREGRFDGSTLAPRALPPMRLYNHWMGRADSGVGGAEWEKTHGRICLPPMLLLPVRDISKPQQSRSS